MFDSVDKPEVAHFFWQGTLGKFQLMCINSFIQNGFDVNLWSYNGLEVEGATSKNAEEILSIEYIDKFTTSEESVQGKNSKWTSISLFSDFFRLQLPQKYEGWWFDFDCFCLKNQKEFKLLREQYPFVISKESEHSIFGTGALYLNKETSTLLIKEFEEKAKKTNNVAPKFIDYGPNLLTEFCQKYQKYDSILPTNLFYGLEWNDGPNMVIPEKTKELKSKIKDSFLIHIWTAQISSVGVDKENPPKGTVLYEFYNGFNNNEIQNQNHINQLNYYKNRYIEVSKIYWKILKRCPDLEGLSYYEVSKLSTQQIEEVFKNSDEYKQRNL
jgi:hypothetical protein